MRGDWDLALSLADYSNQDPPPTPHTMLDAVGLAVAAGRGETSASPGCRLCASVGIARG